MQSRLVKITRVMPALCPEVDGQPVCIPLASKKQQKRASTLFMRLRQLSPALFAGKRPVPMMIGINAEIARRLKLTDPADLAALGIVMRRRVAQTPLPGSARGRGRRLDGLAIEAVSDDAPRTGAASP
jgi:hypothetical protein